MDEGIRGPYNGLVSSIANQNKKNQIFKTAFGVWQLEEIDSVVYQQKLRNEWNKY